MSSRTVRETARRLRKNQTCEEKILWDMLRNRQLLNLKFLRQHPVEFQFNNKDHFYVLDFYCAALKLVIEIDGESHKEQKDRDELRDEILKSSGYTVVRFTNDDVNDRIELIVEEIKKLTPGSAALLSSEEKERLSV